jgi:hypothetical protein
LLAIVLIDFVYSKYEMKMNPIVADTLANPRFQLFATAVFSGATVASLILGYQSLERGQRISRLKNSIPRSEADDGKVRISTEIRLVRAWQLISSC